MSQSQAQPSGSTSTPIAKPVESQGKKEENRSISIPIAKPSESHSKKEKKNTYAIAAFSGPFVKNRPKFSGISDKTRAKWIEQCTVAPYDGPKSKKSESKPIATTSLKQPVSSVGTEFTFEIVQRSNSVTLKFLQISEDELKLVATTGKDEDGSRDEKGNSKQTQASTKTKGREKRIRIQKLTLYENKETRRNQQKPASRYPNKKNKTDSCLCGICHLMNRILI